MKIVFCGTSEFAVPILKVIKKQTDWDVALIVSEPAKPAGRKNQLAHSPVAQAAQELNLNLITPKSIKDAGGGIKNTNPDIMIVVAYGQILPKNIFDLPKYRTVNVHPSLLPKLRGPSPIQTALAQGLTETGVSLMLIDEKLDHGPIISQESFLVGESENYTTLEYQLAQIGASMIVRDLPQYVSGELKPKPQDDAQATHTKLIKKEDGRIDWQKMSAENIHNLWRAYIKWPGIFIFFKNKNGQSVRLKLIEIDPVRSRHAKGTATTASGQSASNGVEKCPTPGVGHNTGEIFGDSSKNIYIACRQGALKIIRLQPENSKILTAREFLNGYGYLIGLTLG